MKQAGIHAEVKCYETGGHGFRLEPPQEPMEQMFMFFKRVLADTPKEMK